MKSKKYLTINAVISTFIVYLDITLKSILHNIKLEGASGDGWWLLILIIACILNWINFASDGMNIKFFIFNFVWQLIPLIIFLTFLFTANNPIDFPYKSTNIIYMVSQVILFMPIYCLYFKMLIKKNIYFTK